MTEAATLGQIEKEIEKLTPQDQLKLVERLAHHLRETGLAENKKLDRQSLYGLGKGLWNGDAHAYVNSIREDRVDV
jgi:hypothetical protein